MQIATEHSLENVKKVAQIILDLVRKVFCLAFQPFNLRDRSDARVRFLCRDTVNALLEPRL
jgi:hypothetical protein